MFHFPRMVCELVKNYFPFSGEIARMQPPGKKKDDSKHVFMVTKEWINGCATEGDGKGCERCERRDGGKKRVAD